MLSVLSYFILHFLQIYNSIVMFQLMRRSTRKLKQTVARIRDASVEEEDTIPLDEIGKSIDPF